MDVKGGSGSTARPSAAPAAGTDPLREAQEAVRRAREQVACGQQGAAAGLVRALGLLTDRLTAAGHLRQAAIDAAERVELLRGMAWHNPGIR